MRGFRVRRVGRREYVVVDGGRPVARVGSRLAAARLVVDLSEAEVEKILVRRG